jgi:hypothetical protein
MLVDFVPSEVGLRIKSAVAAGDGALVLLVSAASRSALKGEQSVEVL